MKKKIAFALIMGIITTGVISFTLISVNVGYGPDFGGIWLRSWVLAYCIATPSILLVGPFVQQFVDKLFAAREAVVNDEVFSASETMVNDQMFAAREAVENKEI